MKRPEQQIQAAVFQHLKVRSAAGTFYFHPFSGGYRRPIEAAIHKRLGAIAGLPDVIAIRGGQVFGLELKADGGRITEIQHETHERMRASGAVVGVAVGLDQALRWLERHDLLKGRVS
jgi:hypothetical protein